MVYKGYPCETQINYGYRKNDSLGLCKTALYIELTVCKVHTVATASSLSVAFTR